MDFHEVGINAKLSELQAAMGLSVLPYMKSILNERRRIVELYDQSLDFTKIEKIRIREGVRWNYSYYPIFLESESVLLSVSKVLNESNILPSG